MPLEPLSDPFKDLLKSVGISPDKFQQGVNAQALMKEIKGRSSTERGNKAYYDTVNRKELIGTIAEKLQKKKPKVYIPLGYVMYVRRSHCNHCGADHTCMDAPGLYLMQTDKLGSPTRQFVPASGVEFPTLEHFTQEIKVDTAYCLDCYTLGQPVPAADGGPTVEALGPSSPTVGSEQPEAPSAASGQACQP